MKNTVKKIINLRFDRYQETEKKLEQLAAEGLFLEKCGNLVWTFRKGESKKVNYTIAFFEEGSEFNPEITENQQIYFEYANAAGWNLVSHLNQIHIFCSDVDNPVPFETDEKEKFNTIKRCMKKGFVLSMAIMMLVFLANLAQHIHTFWLIPSAFFSNEMELLATAMDVGSILYFSYLLFDYYAWCKRSEQSIANGGTCICNTSKRHRTIDILFTCFLVAIVGSMWVKLAFEVSGLEVALGIAQVPVQLLLFWATMKYLKKKKVSATVNKLLSIMVVIVVNFAYMALILFFIFKLEDHPSIQTEYKLPLTCEDLYGKTDVTKYSKEKFTNSTFLLKKSRYYQNPVYAEDASPYLQYDIFETDYSFVMGKVKKEYIKMYDSEEDMEFRHIDNEALDTVEAYQLYDEGAPTGTYILCYPEKIIVLRMEEPATMEQMEQIKEKL